MVKLDEILDTANLDDADFNDTANNSLEAEYDTLINDSNDETLLDESVTIQAALESIQTRGGIDRNFAVTYRSVLPEEWPLTSYTNTVTQTNLEPVQVSLEGRLASLMVAVIGAILVALSLIMKLMGQGKSGAVPEKKEKEFGNRLINAKNQKSSTDFKERDAVIQRFLSADSFSSNKAWNALSEWCLYGQSRNLEKDHIKLLFRIYEVTPIFAKYVNALKDASDQLESEFKEAARANDWPPSKTPIYSIVKNFARELSDNNTGFGSLTHILIDPDSRVPSHISGGDYFNPLYLCLQTNRVVQHIRETPPQRASFNPEEYLKYRGWYTINNLDGSTRIQHFGIPYTVAQSSETTLNERFDFDQLYSGSIPSAISSINARIETMEKLIKRSNAQFHATFFENLTHIKGFTQTYYQHYITYSLISTMNLNLFNLTNSFYKSVDDAMSS